MQIFQVERLPPRLYRFYIITNVNLKHTDYSNKPFIYKDHLSTEILEDQRANRKLTIFHLNGSISRLEYNLHSVLSLKGGGDKSRKSFEITQIAKLNLIILRGLRLRSIFTRVEEYLFIYSFFLNIILSPLRPIEYLFLFNFIFFSFSLFLSERRDYLRTMWDRYFQKIILLRNQVLAVSSPLRF